MLASLPDEVLCAIFGRVVPDAALARLEEVCRPFLRLLSGGEGDGLWAERAHQLWATKQLPPSSPLAAAWKARYAAARCLLAARGRRPRLHTGCEAMFPLQESRLACQPVQNLTLAP